MSSKKERNPNDLPCSVQIWSESLQRDVIARASVECSGNCVGCGFNWKEQRRRMATGHWVKDGGVWTLHFARA